MYTVELLAKYRKCNIRTRKDMKRQQFRKKASPIYAKNTQKSCPTYVTISGSLLSSDDTEGEGFEPPGQLTQLFSRQPQ